MCVGSELRAAFRRTACIFCSNAHAMPHGTRVSTCIARTRRTSALNGRSRWVGIGRTVATSHGDDRRRERGEQGDGGNRGRQRQDGGHAATESKAGPGGRAMIIAGASDAPAGHRHVACRRRHPDGHIRRHDTLRRARSDQYHGEQQRAEATDPLMSHGQEIPAGGSNCQRRPACATGLPSRLRNRTGPLKDRECDADAYYRATSPLLKSSERDSGRLPDHADVMTEVGGYLVRSCAGMTARTGRADAEATRLPGQSLWHWAFRTVIFLLCGPNSHDGCLCSCSR